MSLNLLEPILEESLEEGSQDEVLHYVCLPCNDNLLRPFMECFCGHWDGGEQTRMGEGSGPRCATCVQLREILIEFCPKGHYLGHY